MEPSDASHHGSPLESWICPPEIFPAPQCSAGKDTLSPWWKPHLHFFTYDVETLREERLNEASEHPRPSKTEIKSNTSPLVTKKSQWRRGNSYCNPVQHPSSACSEGVGPWKCRWTILHSTVWSLLIWPTSNLLKWNKCLTVLVLGFGQKCTCVYMCFLSQLLIWGPAQISQFPYERRSRASPPCFRALLILSHNLLSRDFDLPTLKTSCRSMVPPYWQDS